MSRTDSTAWGRRRFFFACLLVLLVGCRDSDHSEALNDSGAPSNPSSDGAPTLQQRAKTDPGPSAEELLRVGFRSLESGDLKAASKTANRILLLDPENPKAMALAGQAAIGQGQIEEGVELLEASADAWPQQSALLRSQAVGALWQANRLVEAEAGFIRLLRKHPGDDDARRGLAELLNQQGFRFDANQQIRLLCARPGIQPSIDELRCLIVPTRAYQPFSEKPTVGDQELIDQMGEMSVARALHGEGDVRDALKVLESGQMVKRRRPAAVALYGQILLEAQQYDRFESWLTQVDDSCKRYPAYWLAMGGWALRQQNPKIAARLFGEAIRREPGDVRAYDQLHQALRAAGDEAQAGLVDQRRTEIRNLIKMTRFILSNPQVGPNALQDLADLLDLIGRPLEAKSWRSLAGYRMGGGIDAMMQADRSLNNLISKKSLARSLQTRLCGIDFSKYPLDLDAIMPAEGTRQPEAENATDRFAGTPDAATPVFVNVAESVGLDFRYLNADPPKDRYFLMHEAVGSGIVCFDYDRDGHTDLYTGQGACNAPDGLGKQPNLLARNLAGQFVTVTEAAKSDDRRYTLGVTSGDWNQDGFPDLIIGNMTGNQLLINQGDGSFRPWVGGPVDGARADYSDPLWDQGKYTSSLAIADVTGDHLPDIVEVLYLDDPGIYEPLEFGDNGIPVRFPGPLHFQAANDRVFRGTGDGGLVGEELPSQSPSPGLGLLITDIDGNLGNEIFVANDMKANHLWMPGEPTSTAQETGAPRPFVDLAVTRGIAYGPAGAALACMGIAAADFDENGFLDLHITNFTDQWTNHYMQNPDNLFDDLTLTFGLDQSSLPMLGFGTEAFDFDHNGTIDLMTGNGHIDDLSHEGKAYQMPTQFFVGDRSTLQETPVKGDPGYWDSSHLTRGLVTLDWNNDGRIDVATSDLKEPLALLENRTLSKNDWIQLELVGVDCERDAIGSSVTVFTAGGREISQTVNTGDGYMSKNQPLLSFGLGTDDPVRDVRIRWADGAEISLGPLASNRRWLAVQHQSVHLVSPPQQR